MPANNIGITFIPNEEAAAMGPKRGGLEGLTEQVFKILSLRLPRVVGARSISPLLGGQGAGPMASAGGFNPNAAVFEALLRSMGRGAGGPGVPQGAPPPPQINVQQPSAGPPTQPQMPMNPQSRYPQRRTGDF